MIRRPVICGQGALIEGDFAGMAATDVAPADSIITMVDGIAMVTREAIDRLQQIIAQSWYWIGGFCAPSDTTTNPTTVPTATNAALQARRYRGTHRLSRRQEQYFNAARFRKSFPPDRHRQRHRRAACPPMSLCPEAAIRSSSRTRRPALAYIRFGSDSTVSAASPDMPVLAGSRIILSVNSLISYAAAISPSGSGSVLFSRGDGSIV